MRTGFVLKYGHRGFQKFWDLGFLGDEGDRKHRDKVLDLVKKLAKEME